VIRPCHTYSIAALDPEGGEMGAAVQSHWFSVGSVVPWAQPGAGVVVTQSFANLSFGPRGLALLQTARGAEKVLEELLAEDPGRELRQVAVLDVRGGAAAHTGTRCVPEAGHRVGGWPARPGFRPSPEARRVGAAAYAVQANMMASPTVWPAMADAFEAARGPLAERMLAALRAAQAEGGDLRGQQSAALLVVRIAASQQPWQDRLVDLRVEDHPRPLDELARLLTVHRCYDLMNRGDLALERSQPEQAAREYGQALVLCPRNAEARFWHGATLAAAGRPEGIARLRRLFRGRPAWRVLARRLRELGLLDLDPAAAKSLGL
jgi:uncharacterized Ntn-hydrolase superfamily protein